MLKSAIAILESTAGSLTAALIILALSTVFSRQLLRAQTYLQNKFRRKEFLRKMFTELIEDNNTPEKFYTIETFLRRLRFKILLNYSLIIFATSFITAIMIALNIDPDSTWIGENNRTFYKNAAPLIAIPLTAACAALFVLKIYQVWALHTAERIFNNALEEAGVKVFNSSDILTPKR